MNRRQEIALWVLVMAMIAPELADAIDNFLMGSGLKDFVRELFFPLALITPLVVYRLRREPAPGAGSHTAIATVLLVLLVAGIRLIDARLDNIESSVDQVQSNVEQLGWRFEDSQ